MHLILLSGGSGQRLWPLSNHSRSKQFLKLLQNPLNPDEPISMIQRVWQQLQETNLAEKTIIATNSLQIDMIRNQLGPDIPIIVEPSRRDTYPAILLAASYLATHQVNKDEVIAVVPVDPLAKEDFFQHLYQLEHIIQQSNADIGLVGIKPTFPSEKYGYILPCHKSNTDYQRVNQFIEKPNQAKASELIDDGALWNGGIFAFKLGFILNHMKSMNYPVQYEKMQTIFSELPKNSFDYELVEKTKNLVVSKYDGEWKDLGTWNTLTEEMNQPLLGKGHISLDSENVHVINELDIPVSVLKGKNLVVVVSSDGILVSDKAASPRVKESAKLFEDRPMYEERRWGSYRVLDYITYSEAYEVLTKRLLIYANKNISYQTHALRSEVWTIIRGKGIFALDGELHEVQPGDVLKIPKGSAHAMKAITNMELIEVQQGEKLIEEDIVRICMTWEEVEKICHKEN